MLSRSFTSHQAKQDLQLASGTDNNKVKAWIWRSSATGSATKTHLRRTLVKMLDKGL